MERRGRRQVRAGVSCSGNYSRLVKFDCGIVMQFWALNIITLSPPTIKLSLIYGFRFPGCQYDSLTRECSL